MSEKASLLSSIPPIKKTESNASQNAGHNPTLTTSASSSNLTASSLGINSEGKNSEGKNSEGQVSLLSLTQTKGVPPPVVSQPVIVQPVVVQPVVAQPAIVPTVQETMATQVNTASATNTASTTGKASTGKASTVAVVAGPQSNKPITDFESITYASFILNFLLAGIVAMIFFKKSAKLVEKRFVKSTKTLGFAALLIMLHGLLATYLYASHLNEAASSAPLFTTMLAWVLAGPAVGFITRNLLARKKNPNHNAAIVDAQLYAAIFFLAACAMSSEVGTNTAMFLSIFAILLMVVPIARAMNVYQVARARHKELNKTSDKILIHSLLFLPALLPVLSFVHVWGLSDSLTLFLINFITFDFLLVVSLSMTASADVFIPGAAGKSAVGVSAAASVPAGMGEVPKNGRPLPQKVGAGNPNDPIIQYLNSEEDLQEYPSGPTRPAVKSIPRVAPPRKFGQPDIKPPKKPDSAFRADSPVSNAPSRLKAPAKPKKRF